MNEETLRQFRETLSQHRQALREWYQSDAPDKKIHLGGAAMQEVLQVLFKLDETLQRIDKGDFGKCEQCSDDGEVDTEQLELDYTTCVCIDHYSEGQIRALERDLELAAKVQKQLLPRYVPALSGIEIAAFTEPAHIVSGDYYWIIGKNGKIICVTADCTGHGVPGAMMSMMGMSYLNEITSKEEIIHSDSILNQLRLQIVKSLRQKGIEGGNQ